MYVWLNDGGRNLSSLLSLSQIICFSLLILRFLLCIFDDIHPLLFTLTSATSTRCFPPPLNFVCSFNIFNNSLNLICAAHILMSAESFSGR